MQYQTGTGVVGQIVRQGRQSSCEAKGEVRQRTGCKVKGQAEVKYQESIHRTRHGVLGSTVEDQAWAKGKCPFK